MSREKTTSQTSQTVEPTSQEKELNELLLERTRASQSGQIQAQQSGLNLINNLLTGGDLPGTLAGLPFGIGEGTTSRLVQESLGDVRTGLQKSGLFDSGVRAELETETAADIRTNVEQFNLQNLQQLLNLAVGGQASIQSPLAQQSQQLSSSLAGLRSTSGSQTVTSPNPFFQQFQRSAGQKFGEGVGNFFFTEPPVPGTLPTG